MTDGTSRSVVAEVTPVRGDDEEQTAKRERYARDDRPGGAKLELRELCGDEPDTCEQHEQKPYFGEAHARPE